MLLNMTLFRPRYALVSLLCVPLLACAGDDEGTDTQAGTSSQTTDSDPTSGGSTDPDSGSGMQDGTGSGGGSSDDGAGSTGGGMSGWEACGLDPPTGPGDSVEPEHPDSPAIVAACTDLCGAWAGVPDCKIDMTACIEDCKLRTCGVCPGTLAPLAECEATNFDAGACTCEATSPSCPVPEACAEQQAQTGFCGG